LYIALATDRPQQQQQQQLGGGGAAACNATAVIV